MKVLFRKANGVKVDIFTKKFLLFSYYEFYII